MKKLPCEPDVFVRVRRQHHIRWLPLFGSVLEATAGLESDVDLLVEFEPGAAPGLLGLAGTEDQLSALLQGRRVDLHTPQDLDRHFRGAVLREAEVEDAA